MRPLLNDALRTVSGAAASLLAILLEGLHQLRRLAFPLQQRRLRRRYRIESRQPILSQGDALQKAIELAAVRFPSARFALTSGSTGEPKRILYPGTRLRKAKLVFWDFFLRACRARGIHRQVLYVFSSLERDASVTSLMLEEQSSLSRLSLLPAPYRVEALPVVRELAREYGVPAVRLWILTLSNPGLLYATNPSTICVFFDRLKENWTHHSRLIRDYLRFVEDPPKGTGSSQVPWPSVKKVAHLLESRGCRSRLASVSESSSFLEPRQWNPGLEALICWTGGYLAPFLERLRQYLPEERYPLIPMYSMSTETIETTGHFPAGTKATTFLPLAPGVLYEFLPSDSSDRPEHLIAAPDLEADQVYSLVVSDGYGLRRYQTEDLFRCRRFCGGLPDLVFVGRRGLQYSLTGEKLTAPQAAAGIEVVRDKIRAARFLSCVPSWPAGEPVPHYKLVIVQEDAAVSRDYSAIARLLERELSGLNPEYRGKRASGRLGPVRACRVSLAEFLARLGGPEKSRNWESQFKFLPLYSTLWEQNARQSGRGAGSSPAGSGEAQRVAYAPEKEAFHA